MRWKREGKVKVRALDHFRVILDRKPRQWQTFYQQGRPLLCRREKKKIVQYKYRHSPWFDLL